MSITKDIPDHLSESTRILNRVPLKADGEFVLYRMHHAVRGHENPALDTAVFIADRLGLPVLVYQGLGDRHPYNSDRHHTFIMAGARDVQEELALRGITYCFHLVRDPCDPAPLNELTVRAPHVLTCVFRRHHRIKASSAHKSEILAEGGCLNVRTPFFEFDWIRKTNAPYPM